MAVEWRFDRVQKIWSKKQNRSLSNLFIVCGDAQIFIRDYLKDSTIDAAYVNFPDPWPKEKHAKNRLFQPHFIAEMTRTLRPGATLTVATDDPPYSAQIVTTVLSNSAWSSLHPEPYYMTQWDGYGTSFFDTLWREKGREIRYFQFKK